MKISLSAHYAVERMDQKGGGAELTKPVFVNV